MQGTMLQFKTTELLFRMFEVRYNANNQGRPFQRNNARGNVVARNARARRMSTTIASLGFRLLLSQDALMNVMGMVDVLIEVQLLFIAVEYMPLILMTKWIIWQLNTMFMVNLSSEDPIYDEARPSYDSNTQFEVQDHDTFVDHMDEYHEVHEMQSDVQHNSSVCTLLNDYTKVDIILSLHNESKHISKLEREYLNLQLKYQHLQESFDNKKSQASQEAPDFNSFFKIKNLEHQIQEKDNVIRDLKVLVSNVNDRSCEPYNANDVTDLLEQNERLRAEIEKVKQHYKEMFESIKITRTSTNEKTSSLLTQIEDLKAQLEGNLKVAARSSVKTKVLALELVEYVIGTCPKEFTERDSKAPSIPLTRKKQVTFTDTCSTSTNNTQKHRVHQKTQLSNVQISFGESGLRLFKTRFRGNDGSCSFSVGTRSYHDDPGQLFQGFAPSPLDHTIEDTSITQADLHPSVNPVEGEPSSAQSTSGDVSLAEPNQLASDALWCCYHTVLSKVEPKNFKMAVNEDSWFKAMQDEIHEFDRLKCNRVLERQKKLRNQIFRALTASADVPSSVTETTDTTSTLPPPPPPLQKPTGRLGESYDQKSRMSLVDRTQRLLAIQTNQESDMIRIHIIGMIKRSKCENKGIVPTEMELVLEYTQQGASHEVSEHLKMEMEIPCSNKIKFITACSFSNDSFEDIMKAQVSVIKASATLNIQAFKIKKSVSISFRMTQVHKMAKDHMMMIRDYDWMMISKKLKDHIQVKLKPKSLKFTTSDSQDTNQ
ncbi:hypothetical protein Tco_0489153 [Tanacetum coccineum]